VDDCLSVGQSLLEGVKMLKDYNIKVVDCLYLVDRSKDRFNLGEEKQYLLDEEFDSIRITSVYDLYDIDKLIKE
jgi:orotate phosphoribosyltransferase